MRALSTADTTLFLDDLGLAGVARAVQERQDQGKLEILTKYTMAGGDCAKGVEMGGLDANLAKVALSCSAKGTQLEQPWSWPG